VTKDFSDVTGLPDDLGIGEDLTRAEQRLSVRVESRRYGKPMTIVEGFDDDSVDLKQLASTLKRRLATGGTVEKETRTIELQGDHADRLPPILRDEGFQVA